MPKRPCLDPVPARILRSVILVVCLASHPAFADETVLHLRSGDRVSGTILSETPEQVVLSNLWVHSLAVPIDQIERREQPPAAAVAGSQTLLPAAPNANAPETRAQRPPGVKHWTGEAQLGLDLLYDATDRQIYNGRIKLAYQRPYVSDPKEFFRNALDYSVDYGKTDGIKSSDRMAAEDKAQLDVGGWWYLYNLAGEGYDHIQKINFQYEEGPGTGYHVLTGTNFQVNAESGVDYQSQFRSDGSDVQDFYYRLAEDVRWKVMNRTTVIEKFEFFPLVNLTDFRFRLESTLSYELWKNLAWNLTVLDRYDSQPATGVEENDAEIRSSLGVKF